MDGFSFTSGGKLSLSVLVLIYATLLHAQFNLNTGFVVGYGAYELENALLDSTFGRTRSLHGAVGFTLGQTYRWRALRAGLWYAFHTGTAYEIDGGDQRGGLRRSHHSLNLSAEILFQRFAIGTEVGYSTLRYTIRLPDREDPVVIRTRRYPLVHPFVQYAIVQNSTYRLYLRCGVLLYRSAMYGEELIRALGYHSTFVGGTSRVFFLQFVFYNGPLEY